MDNFALIDAIRTYCETEGYIFIYGNDQYANALADINNSTSGKIIVVADFTIQSTLTSSMVTEIRYNGLLMVGEKHEDSTESSLDETPIQKYDRRLLTLTTLWHTIVGDLTCQNELEATGINIRYDLNKFDLNADFVAGQLTLIQ